MVRPSPVWFLLVPGLVLVRGSDEGLDLNHDEDLLHPSFAEDSETWAGSNTDQDLDRDLSQDLSRDLDQDLSRDLDQDLSQDLSRDLSRDLSWNLSKDLSQDRTKEPNRDHHGTSVCGDFLSEVTPDGFCRMWAVLPSDSGSSPQERCPDLFRCSAEVSDWPREAGNRKQQLQELQDDIIEMKQELKEHQRKHLEAEGHVTPNSSMIGRLRALELRQSEVTTLLHVHAALMHELQLQLQNLSRTLHSMCTLTHVRLAASITLPAPPVVSSCPSDCASLIQNGVRKSGIYSIVLAPGVSLPVYCDMETDGGGWTVFQRRRDGSVSFNRGWNEYSVGFGDLRSEHWLGNTPLHLLVTQRHYSLRVHLQDWSHVLHHALYLHFSVESEQGRFRLHVSGFSGSVSDSFGWYHDGQDFATPDSGHLCAEVCHSGWWFRQCYRANLNGVYYQGGLYSLRSQNLLAPDGLVWFSLRDSDFYTLKATTMMVRPRDFRTPRSP